MNINKYRPGCTSLGAAVAIVVLGGSYTTGSTNAALSVKTRMNLEVQRPAYAEQSRRIEAGSNRVFALNCSAGFQIVSGGYELLSIGGGHINQIKVQAASVDLQNNRYYVKLSHDLPYNGGAHPLVTTRVYGTCIRLP